MRRERIVLNTNLGVRQAGGNDLQDIRSLMYLYREFVQITESILFNLPRFVKKWNEKTFIQNIHSKLLYFDSPQTNN